MEKKLDQLKVVFRPICYIQEIYRTIRCNASISGLDYVSKHSGPDSAFQPLVCEICNKISE